MAASRKGSSRRPAPDAQALECITSLGVRAKDSDLQYCLADRKSARGHIRAISLILPICFLSDFFKI